MDAIYFFENQGPQDKRDNSPLFKVRLKLNIPLEVTFSDFDTDRKELHDALETLQSGDRLLIRSIQDLADNTKDLFKVLQRLSSTGVTLVTIEETYFNGRNYFLVFKKTMEVCDFYKEQNRKTGFQKAKKRKALGRPLNENADYALTLYQSGKYTISEIVRLSGVSKSTLYKHIGKSK